MSTKSLPATLAQFQAMRDLAIPYDADHPPTFDEAAKLLSEKIRGTPADRSEGWPVPSSSPIDDLREAVRPRPLRPEALVVGPAQAANIRRAFGGDINHARDDDDRADFDRRYPVHPAQGIVNDESVTMDPKTQGALSKGLLPLTKPDDGPVVFRTYGFAVRRPPWPRTLDPNKSYPFDSLEGRQAIGANPPASVDLTEPHVATLPDGRAVNLPAGTVLREGMTWDGPPADPLRDLCEAFKANPDPTTAAMITKLREQVDRGASPLLAQALDLLRRARPRLVDEPESKRLDGEIVAFLAGMPIVSEGSQPLTLAELCAWAADEAKGTAAIMGDKIDPYLDGKSTPRRCASPPRRYVEPRSSPPK